MKGFGLIGILIGVAIIALVVAGFYKTQDSGSGEEKVDRVDAINMARDAVDSLNQHQNTIENEL